MHRGGGLHRAPPDRPRTHGGGMPPHTQKPSASPAKERARRSTRRAGSMKRRPRRDGGCSLPGIGTDPCERRGFQHFGGRFHPGFVFSCPLFLGFHLYGRRCFRGLNTIIPPPTAPGLVQRWNAHFCTQTPWCEPYHISIFMCFC